MGAQLADKGEGRKKAIMASLRLSDSRPWLNMVPSPALGLHLRPSEFTVGHKLCLEIAVFTSSCPRPACWAPSDRPGIVIIPLALETLRGWHVMAEAELRKPRAALAMQTGPEDGVAISHLF